MVAPRRRIPEATPLRISVDRSDPTAPAIRIGGDLAFTTVAPLRAEVDRLLAQTPRRWCWTSATCSSSTAPGLSLIVHAWRDGQRGGTAIQLRETPRFLATILDMTGISGLLSRPQPDPPPARPTTGPPARV